MRWAPTLPSFGGRLATRVTLPPELEGGGYSSKLEEYLLERENSLDIFTHRVNMKFLRKKEHTDLIINGKAPYLEDLPGFVLYEYLIYGITLRMSRNFTTKLRHLCLRKDIPSIKRWYQTVDGLVLPLLLTVEDPDTCYADIDKLVKFGFENCANNYAHFISRMKSLKRLLRKDYAIMTDGAKVLYDVSTYRKMYMKHLPTGGRDPHRDVQYLLCWTQTRGSGLADSVMIRKSLDKCELTLSTPRRAPVVASREYREYKSDRTPTGEPKVPGQILFDMSCRIRARIRGETGHLSAGPNSCLESTRSAGGQTGYISRLSRAKALHRVYDHRTLEWVETEPRPTRTSKDVLDWAIQEVHTHPTYVRCVRLHAVPEPSKARTITVCTLPYLLVVGVLSKVLQPAIASDISRTGLHASRNLWKFLYEDLDPTSDLWYRIRDEHPKDQPIMGLSSDLEEATDYGDIGVARQILHGVLSQASTIPGFPVGLALLAKTLFIGKRFCLRQDGGRARWFTKHNGWLMGDRLTKVVLTLAHELVIRASGLHLARICGDDVIALSRDKSRLDNYQRVVTEMGFKISSEDHYVSSRLIFYCEEGAVVPQTFQELPAVSIRRKRVSCYVDYPRVRLLIPTLVETKVHSFTDIGRYTLLGKETRWVHQSGHQRSIALFDRATMIQHLSVPRSPDTICPFIPLEIGGDGSFPKDPTFLQKTISRKARDQNEVWFRMRSLLEGKWGYRLVRNANLNDVVHKYHTLVPKIRELKELLPKEALIEGNELLLNSIKVSGVESPERTFFRIWRAWYWHEILQGRTPPEVRLNVQKAHDHPDTEVQNLGALSNMFHKTWRDAGFTFENNPDYLVETRSVHVLDYMNMGWWFGTTTIPSKVGIDDLGARFLLNEESMESFINHIKEDSTLDPKVKQNLHRYVESDSYIKWEFSRLNVEEIPCCILLISTDIKLALDLVRIARSKTVGRAEDPQWDEGTSVVLVPPHHYLYGMLEPYEETFKRISSTVSTIVDHGSVNYHQFTMNPEFEFFDTPMVQVSPARGDPSLGVYHASLYEMGEGPSTRWSLTTTDATQWRPGRIIFRARPTE